MIDENEGFDYQVTTGGYTASVPVPEQPWIELKGGVRLTASEAKTALDEAMTIVEAVGKTGIHAQPRVTGRWMRKFYPARA